MYKLLLCWRYLRTRYIALACIVSVILVLGFGHVPGTALDLSAANDAPSISGKKSGPLNDIRGMLTPRSLDVEVLDFVQPEDILRIQAKIKRAAIENQAWLQEHIKQAPAGQSLPYHEKLGVTKDEYQRFLKHATKAKLVPTGKGKVKFSSRTKDQIVINDLGGLPELDGVTIDLGKQQIVTSWGTVAIQPIHVNEGSVFGAWDGYSGRLQTGSPESKSFKVVRVNIGRQAMTGQNLFNLSVRVVENRVKTAAVETSIRFR